MKTSLLLSGILTLAIPLMKAQQLPNSSFDSVYFGGIDRLFEWITADGFRMMAGIQWPDTVQSLEPDSTYIGTGFMFHELVWLNNQSDTSPHSFASTVIINRPSWYKSNGDVFPGFLITGNSITTDKLGYPDISRCGIPFSYRPTKLEGFYHFVDSTSSLSNFGKCYILLKKWNSATGQRDTIGFAESTIQLGPNAGFTPFALDIVFRNTATPDTLMIAFLASSNPNNASALWLDELSLTYNSIGVTEDEMNTAIVYPNPLKNEFFVNTLPGTTFELYDTMGRIISSGRADKSIDVSNQAEQAIFLKLIFPNGEVKSYKLINER